MWSHTVSEGLIAGGLGDFGFPYMLCLGFDRRRLHKNVLQALGGMMYQLYQSGCTLVWFEFAYVELSSGRPLHSACVFD